MAGYWLSINLYLKQKKSNQINVLIGFLPNNNQLSSKKTLITGEGNLNLKNALGSGETIGLNFQALQVESKRLNLLYQHPFLFKSPVGLDFSFDMFLKRQFLSQCKFSIGSTICVEYKPVRKTVYSKSADHCEPGRN